MENNIPTPEERRHERTAQRETSGLGVNSPMRTVFGIIMIAVYVGMGVLLLINFFGWEGDWSTTRYPLGILLILYGIWRAYRQIKGID